MKRSLYRTLAHLTGLGMAAVVILSPGCADTQNADTPESRRRVWECRVDVAGSIDKSAGIQIPGKVEANNRADVSSRLSARVETISVGIGSTVSQGEVLATLDSRDLAAQLLQAEAMQEQATLDFNRAEALTKSGSISQQEFDAVSARKKSADASVSVARAMRSHATVTSPFDGIIVVRNAQVGDMATPGMVLFTIEQSAPVFFATALPATYSSAVSVGDTVAIVIDKSPAPLHGVVAELSKNADPATQSHTLRIRVDSHAARPGQFGRLVLTPEVGSRIAIHAGAVKRRGQLEIVYVADSSNHANLRLVRIGERRDSVVEILSGLDLNERVIVGAQDGLTEGDSIIVGK